MFPTRAQINAPGAFGIAMCDVTGDGLDDLLVSDDSQSVLILRDGKLEDFVTGLGLSFERIVCAELNQNETADLIGLTDRFEGPQVVLLLDVPAGPSRTLTTAPFGNLYAVAAGDLNGDGLVDLAMAGSNDLVRFQDPGGQGFFTSAGGSTGLVTEGLVDRLSIVDQDGDNANDIVYRGYGTVALLLQREGQAGLFHETRTLFESRSRYFDDVLVADLDRVGRREIVTGDYDGPVILSLTTGDDFSVTTVDATEGAGGRLAVGDANGDGLPEIAMAAYDLTVFRQLEPMVFDPSPESIPIGLRPDDVVMGDIDGDQMADVVLLQSPTVSLFLTAPTAMKGM